MTVEEFAQLANGAPWELDKFARIAAEIVDDEELRDAGSEFLYWHDELLRLLESREIELG